METSNLDGETNLKIRQAHTETANLDDQNIVSLFFSIFFCGCVCACNYVCMCNVFLCRGNVITGG